MIMLEKLPLAKVATMIVAQINALEPDVEKLSDDQLRARTDEFQEKYKDGADLDDLLPDAFATVREAAKRTLGQRHYDVQMLGGMVLHQGKISEMQMKYLDLAGTSVR